MKVLDFVKFGGLPFTEDTTEPFSGISWTFFLESSCRRALEP